MRNLIVCCDGTWNTPDQKQDGVPVPTNVVRLHNAVARLDDQGSEQLKYYHPGVGTDGKWWEKLAGGTVGVGLSKNIMSAYKWLGVNYQDDDHIFLFGFSRGAYTARSLGGMVSTCGLLDLSSLSEKEVWKRVDAAYKRGYRGKKHKSEWARDWACHRSTDAAFPIFFLGVWDTVGALGVPDDMAILNLLDSRRKYAFHDTTLGPEVVHARHAVAIDEMRASFAPTLWTGVQSGRDVKQIWFPGVHCDVGGGYREKGLSDGTLKWMMDEATAVGLVFQSGMCQQVQPDHLDVLHDSRTGFFEYLRTQPRSVPLLVPANVPDAVHRSALDRHVTPPIAQAPYRPTIVLATGKQKQLPVYAVQPWNETGVYLQAGATYRFTATGEWLDRKIKCGPGGTKDGKFGLGELAHLAGALWGKVEGVVGKLTRNDEADFRGTRRVEDMPWFALVGAIANGGNPGRDGTPAPHEHFLIGDGTTLTVEQPGYLYCFANDAWHFYDNNRGSVMLTIERVP